MIPSAKILTLQYLALTKNLYGTGLPASAALRETTICLATLAATCLKRERMWFLSIRLRTTLKKEHIIWRLSTNPSVSRLTPQSHALKTNQFGMALDVSVALKEITIYSIILLAMYHKVEQATKRCKRVRTILKAINIPYCLLKIRFRLILCLLWLVLTLLPSGTENLVLDASLMSSTSSRIFPATNLKPTQILLLWKRWRT